MLQPKEEEGGEGEEDEEEDADGEQGPTWVNSNWTMRQLPDADRQID